MNTLMLSRVGPNIASVRRLRLKKNDAQKEFSSYLPFVHNNDTMLGFQEPLDCRVNYTGVLDLRVKVDDGWTSPKSSESSISPPPPMDVVSPTIAITQRVLAAAQTPQGTRPFKAYPKDPLTLSSTHNEAFFQFRQQMLAQVRNGKCAKKRPSSPTQQPSSSGGETDDKDAAYWERRRKNNEAAKRSRDARRAKEDEIAIRAAFLEQENLRLKYQVAALTDETAKLRCMLYKTEHSLL